MYLNFFSRHCGKPVLFYSVECRQNNNSHLFHVVFHNDSLSALSPAETISLAVKGGARAVKKNVALISPLIDWMDYY